MTFPVTDALTITRVREHVAIGLLSIADNPLLLLLIINVILLVIGCFMETIAAISILVPILMPVGMVLSVCRASENCRSTAR